MPAVAGPGAAAPALTVTRASVVAVWKESYLLKGRSVRFSGSVAGPAQLRAFIRPAAGGATLITKDFSVPAAGAFNGLVLPLPARPLPGAYTLRVFGTASGAQLPAVDRTVRIPAPATGIVDQAIAERDRRRAPGPLGCRPAERSALPFPLHLPAEGEQGAGGLEDAAGRFVGETLDTSSTIKPYAPWVYTRVRSVGRRSRRALVVLHADPEPHGRQALRADPDPLAAGQGRSVVVRCGRFRFRGYTAASTGAVAQLGERQHGMQEVTGSSPVGSTSPE